jgi:glycosyltransferase involved in cell wall biosynthesis
MEKRGIHIVSFDIPSPPNYGGIIDVYYKAKALAEIGYEIHLHCFEYGRERQEELLSFCKSVNYYQRKPFWRSIFSIKPYIIHSRENKLLLLNLQKDNLPILFEGIHTSGIAKHSTLKNRIKSMRTYNVEYLYYWHLAKAENTLWKKVYFLFEALKLKIYESQKLAIDSIFAISNNDAAFFAKYNTTVSTIFPFHSVSTPLTKEGRGNYILYHGNLEVKENQLAIKVLCEKVFAELPNLAIIVAGKNPDQYIVQLLSKFQNVELIKSPNEEKLTELIENAHIHLLPTFQNTGIKLKLIHSLFKGRFCLANSLMVTESVLKNDCVIEDDLSKWPELILKLMKQEFTSDQVKNRIALFNHYFDNQINAKSISRILHKSTN